MTNGKFATFAAVMIAAAVASVTAQERKSEKPSFSIFTDKRDGQVYKTVKIGEQTWMAQNLNYAAQGSACYDGKEENCAKYGRLYGYGAPVADKICPDGWHLPTNAEWETLINYVGGAGTAGTKLKSASGWNDNGNGSNDFGFSALPGGESGYDEKENYYYGNKAGYVGYWYSATKEGSGCYWRWYMRGDKESVSKIDYDGCMSSMYSVRCVKNEVPVPDLKGTFSIQLMADADLEEVRKEKAKAEAAISQRPVFMAFIAPYYKLYVGDFYTKAEAQAVLPEIKNKGYKDAWLVAASVIMSSAR